MRRIVWLVVTVVLTATLTSYAQRRAGGRAGGGFNVSIENDWALICFELGVGPTTLNQLRLVYQTAWDERAELMVRMHNQEIERSEMRGAMESIQTALDAGRNQQLSERQIEKLVKLRSSRRRPTDGGGFRGGR